MCERVRYILFFSLIVSAVLILPSCRNKKKGTETGKKTVNKEVAVKPGVQHNQYSGQSEFRNKLHLSQREIKENRLYAFLDDWYGVPYKYGGCDKKGVDCSCFTNLVYQQVYHKTISRSAAEMFNACDKISMDEVKEGDLLFFKIGGNTISHVGIFVRSGYFVHSSTSKGVIINNLEEAYYKKYFFCAGKIKSA